MPDSERFEERYRTGNTPWDHGQPDSNLMETVIGQQITPCKVLDVGCGTGDNAIWLARYGFEIIGCDISPTAIEEARRKAEATGAECVFHVLDFLVEKMPGGPFGFVFDRGCLHSFDKAEQREEFARRAHSYLENNGLWLTLAGNADGPTREIGPPRFTAEKLVTAVEPYFQILSLVSGHFGAGQPKPPEAWICLMRKRNTVS